MTTSEPGFSSNHRPDCATIDTPQLPPLDGVRPIRGRSPANRIFKPNLRESGVGGARVCPRRVWSDDSSPRRAVVVGSLPPQSPPALSIEFGAYVQAACARLLFDGVGGPNGMDVCGPCRRPCASAMARVLPPASCIRRRLHTQRTLSLYSFPGARARPLDSHSRSIWEGELIDRLMPESTKLIH